MYSLKIFTLLCVFMCLWMPQGQAQTADVIENYRKEMPKLEPLSAEAFEEASQSYTYKPEDNEKMHFQMRYPKDWKAKATLEDSQLAFSQGVISEIVTFVSPARVIMPRSQIVVEFSELRHEISAEHWVLKYMLSLIHI